MIPQRALVCFGFLAVLAALLLGRLVHLQVVRAPLNRASADRQRLREEALPAPRGTIVDRDGALLAYDRPVLEVRAEAYATLTEGREAEELDAFATALAADLAFALAAAPAERGPAQDETRARLRARALACEPRDGDLRPLSPAERGGPARTRRRLDFLVAPAVESAAALRRLREVDARRDWLYLHFLQRFERTYPDRELTWGAVGFVGERDLGGGRSGAVYRGMEAFAGLLPGVRGARELWQDAAATRYWTERLQAPAAPAVLQSTLDLALQHAAHDELARAVEGVRQQYGAPPDWGAMCLAELETGEVLALASYRAGVDSPAAGAFAPLQCLCEPGSVVKPLVFSLALERGVLDWDGETIDCRPTDGNAWRVPGSRRPIRDSHACGVLAPRDVIVQSSNIGAVKVGLRLGRDGMADYVESYRFATKTAMLLPGEVAGRLAHTPDEIRALSDRQFGVYTGPSLSFGYEYLITPVQLLRAYVTLLSGRPRELRLFRRIAHDGRVVDLPPEPEAPRFLSERTVARLREAMVAVVSPDPLATGRTLYRELEPLAGAEVPVAGKTGTSEVKRGGGHLRTASFAGYAPLARPRFVAVCVLQKQGAASFWGGSYAGPAAGRLLLRALAQPSSRRREEPQVSAVLSEGAWLPIRQR